MCVSNTKFECERDLLKQFIMLRRVHTPKTTPFLKMSVRETVSEFNAFVDTL